ncbi:MAG: hypothetical protein M0R46_07400 [Candidatus Muirbacterium halophilum]|nr:hypothetical protein [Candidatus Muirbacterium halophilum]MCK9475725.1 hypothetical protein [Candidatus Muirbacterium halophilum]
MIRCKVCGKELWDLNADICDNNKCFIEWEFEKKKKYEKIKLFHEILVIDSEKRIDLFPSRPWTASCVDNLYINMKKKWSAEKTSLETKRKLDEVKFMERVLKKVGYNNLRRVLVKLEKNKKKQDISKEIDWLREIGVLNFFVYFKQEKQEP